VPRTASRGAFPPNPPPPAAGRAAAAPPPRENHLSAGHSLAGDAGAIRSSSHGDLDGASSTLDRALRIEPNNPLLWIELGRLRLAENDAHQAEGCGRKALRSPAAIAATQAQAGRLLADALRAQGRNPEAVEVERQPFMR
jgi:predicted Zn-dependent protease